MNEIKNRYSTPKIPYGFITGGMGLLAGLFFGISATNMVRESSEKKNVSSAYLGGKQDGIKEGIESGSRMSMPKSAMFRDVNNDGIQDLVVMGDRPYIFIQDTNSSFMSWDRYQFLKTRELEKGTDEQLRKLKEDFKNMENSIFRRN